DLSAYKGHPAHIEFTAAGGADFEIAKVVQAERAPPAPERVNQALLGVLGDTNHNSPVDLARGYQRFFQDAANCLDSGRMQESPDCADFCRLANWVLDHPELRDAKAESCKPLVETAGKFITEENRLRSAIKQDSRLALAM